jgi:hypothetical protein
MVHNNPVEQPQEGHHHADEHSHHPGGSSDAGKEQLGHDDEPDVHGMFVCGEQAVFFSHLPMFGHPHHDFQVVLGVTLEPVASDADPMAAYLQDRKASGETLYTFAPKKFRLPDIVGSGDPPIRPAIVGSVVRGHFEKGGKRVTDARVTIDTIFHLRQFDEDEEPPEELEYILFGKGKELFLAHRITRSPDFDQVVSVDSSDLELTEEQRASGPSVAFSSRSNMLSERLKPQDKVTGTLLGPDGSKTAEASFRVLAELYFEEGELASPASFNQTAEEKKAGFR